MLCDGLAVKLLQVALVLCVFLLGLWQSHSDYSAALGTSFWFPSAVLASGLFQTKLFDFFLRSDSVLTYTCEARTLDLSLESTRSSLSLSRYFD